MRRTEVLGCLAALLIGHSVQAVSYPLPPTGSRLVGSSQVITVPDRNTLPLEAFAARYGQGLSNMLEANPGVDPFLPKSGTRLVIPQQLILPDTVREGIVVNVAEMRLYYYPPGSHTVDVLPIGIGQAGRETPRNWVTAVERKQEGPTWSPTPNTRRAYAAEGKRFRPSCPPGRITRWACMRYISAGCMRFTAPTRISVSGYGLARDVFVCVTPISNIFSIMFPWAPVCRLSIAPLK